MTIQRDTQRAWLMRHLTPEGWRELNTMADPDPLIAITCAPLDEWEKRYRATFGEKNGREPLPSEYVFSPELERERKAAGWRVS